MGIASILIFKWGGEMRSCVSTYCTQILLECEHICVDPIRRSRARREEKERIEELMCYYRGAYHDMLSRYTQSSGIRSEIALSSADTEYINRYKTDYMVHAQVIGRTFSLNEHIFYIDVGANRGATDQMSVVYKNCLVGRIIEVFPFYSTVMLVTDPRSKIAAYDEQTNASGMIQGTALENKLTYSFVSHLHKVALADMIFSSGEGIVYPRGFLIGKISKLFGTDGLHHRIDVEPAVDYHAIEYCYVLQKGAEYCTSKENTQENSLAQKVAPGQSAVKPFEQHAAAIKVPTNTVAEKTTWQKIFTTDKSAKHAKPAKEQKEKLLEQAALADNNKPVESMPVIAVDAGQIANSAQSVAVQEAVPVRVEQNSAKQEPVEVPLSR